MSMKNAKPNDTQCAVCGTTKQSVSVEYVHVSHCPTCNEGLGRYWGEDDELGQLSIR